jgi:hypothetical protein
MIIQLNPTIPMTCPAGAGHAIALLDYSQEHHLIWVIAIDETGEIWSYPNPKVRMQHNITMNRLLKEKSNEEEIHKEVRKENAREKEGNVPHFHPTHQGCR